MILRYIDSYHILNMKYTLQARVFNTQFSACEYGFFYVFNV